jgi:hypothetical protein
MNQSFDWVLQISPKEDESTNKRIYHFWVYTEPKHRISIEEGSKDASRGIKK